MNLKLFILLLLIAISAQISAQGIDFNYINSKTKGVLIGTSFIDEHLPEGNTYHPVTFIYNISFPLLKLNADRKSNLHIQFEPQLNPVFISNVENSIEFGINVGFLYHKLIGDQATIFAGIGSGPHFISAQTRLQARGFIFSDNFIFGYRQLISIQNPMELNFQIRFRHISNAGIKQPNYGIDNFFILVGLSRAIPLI